MVRLLSGLHMGFKGYGDYEAPCGVHKMPFGAEAVLISSCLPRPPSPHPLCSSEGS